MYNFNIKTICINLKRREDRLQNFIKNCLIENVKIFNAIDGKTINDELIVCRPFKKLDEIKVEKKLEIFRKHSKNFLYPRQIGCFLSHYYLWKKILDDNLDKLLILEDDCIFQGNFKERFIKLLSQIDIANNNNQTINLLYVGGRHWNNYKSRTNRVIKINELIYKYDQYQIQNWIPGAGNKTDCSGETIICNDLDRTTSAYILTYKGAEILINKFNSLNPINNMPVDHFILNTFKDLKEPIYHSCPLLIKNPSIYTKDSDVR